MRMISFLSRKKHHERTMKNLESECFDKDIYPFKIIHHVDKRTLDYFFQDYSPVFFLNTGRSGSAFLESVFKQFNNIDAYHEASPNLMMFPNYAFHNQSESKMLANIFLAARAELMLNSFIKNKIYIETNHCLVFFSNQIKEIFPKARFVHILRHPGSFVRSAVMKGWHKNDSIWENNRVRIQDEEDWKRLTQIERLAWTWNATHSFIENFKATTDADFLTVKLEDLISSSNSFNQMLKFLDSDMSLEESMIKKLQNEKVNEISISPAEPPNMFKLPDYPKYRDWSTADKEDVGRFAGDLAERYGYSL